MDWQSIETAPVDCEVLLFCPERHFSNKRRIEVGAARTSAGSHHAWATHWMPMPDGPTDEQIEAAFMLEQEREYHERMAEAEYHREMEATHR